MNREFDLQLLRAFRGGVTHERDRIVQVLLKQGDGRSHELAMIIANTDKRDQDEIATQPGVRREEGRL